MIRRPPKSPRTDTRFPDSRLCRSAIARMMASLALAVAVLGGLALLVSGPGYRLGWWTLSSAYDLLSYGLLRSEEHTSELQSLMRISYAVFCLKKQLHNDISNHGTQPTLHRWLPHLYFTNHNS